MMQVGLVLLIEGNEQNFPRYAAIRQLAREAEAAAFDSLWFYDHLLFREESGPKGQWECFTLLAALAEATQQIQLGTLVACTPFRNPAMLAKIASALDEVSQGRFVLGLGAGWNEAEFKAFGYPFDHRVDRLEEALQIIRPLLQKGKVDFRGRYHEASDCVNLPTRQLPGPSLMLGANGPRMLRLAARYADSINTGFNLNQPQESKAKIAAACQAEGRDPETLEFTTTMWAAFPDLGPTPPWMNEDTYAAAEPIADRLFAYHEQGLHHVMVDFQPNNSLGLARMAEALVLYRAQINS